MPHLVKNRKDLEIKLKNEFGNQILYGPYKGMRLHQENYWGTDNPSMRFGLYEKEVLKVINLFKGKLFINIGAGDGYYSVGQVFNESFEKSFCFEMSGQGREKIQELADINGVTQKIIIKGVANESWLDNFESNLENSLVLCDVEGDEFNLFNHSHFTRLAMCPIIIEIHDWVEGASEKIQKIIDYSSDTHDLNVLKTGARDLSNFLELHHYRDEEKWMLVMEGRPKLMSWFLFTPK